MSQPRHRDRDCDRDVRRMHSRGMLPSLSSSDSLAMAPDTCGGGGGGASECFGSPFSPVGPTLVKRNNHIDNPISSVGSDSYGASCLHFSILSSSISSIKPVLFNTLIDSVACMAASTLFAPPTLVRSCLEV